MKKLLLCVTVIVAGVLVHGPTSSADAVSFEVLAPADFSLELSCEPVFGLEFGSVVGVSPCENQIRFFPDASDQLLYNDFSPGTEGVLGTFAYQVLCLTDQDSMEGAGAKIGLFEVIDDGDLTDETLTLLEVQDAFFECTPVSLGETVGYDDLGFVGANFETVVSPGTDYAVIVFSPDLTPAMCEQDETLDCSGDSGDYGLIFHLGDVPTGLMFGESEAYFTADAASVGSEVSEFILPCVECAWWFTSELAPFASVTSRGSSSISRVTFDPNGGVCSDSGDRATTGLTHSESWTSVFLGYRYLPNASDCHRDGFVFAGWASTADPSTVLSLPRLRDPRDGQVRMFLVGKADLTAVWST